MNVKRKTVTPKSITAFWDTSAIVPLCCFQSQTTKARQIARTYSRQVVWWATSIEAVSSFNRLLREELLTKKEYTQVLTRLDYLRYRWNEVQPSEEVRLNAERLLGIYKLRAADALQLSAALVWCSGYARGHHFIGADGNLSLAAEQEGFTVIHLL
jgi:predicted nucleic acid-binding protein